MMLILFEFHIWIADLSLEISTSLEVQQACCRSALAQIESLVDGLGF